jgi:hypothetical protein
MSGHSPWASIKRRDYRSGEFLHFCDEGDTSGCLLMLVFNSEGMLSLMPYGEVGYTYRIRDFLTALHRPTDECVMWKGH